MQLDLPKPLGFKFARGNDGGAYIIEVNPKAGNIDARVQVRAALPALGWAGLVLNAPNLVQGCPLFTRCVPLTGSVSLTGSIPPSVRLLLLPQPGDKIVEISASFGSEVWKAENFGQVRRRLTFSCLPGAPG